MWMPQFVTVYLAAGKVRAIKCGALVKIVKPPNELIDSHTVHQLMFNRRTRAAARYAFKDTFRGVK